MYLIDKVTRMRSKYGRFGVDHSEVLNYELELANRPRDDHMNHLVYKEDNPYDETENVDSTLRIHGNMSTSQILFKRLSNQGKVQDSSRCSLLDDNKYRGSERSHRTNKNAPNFTQWVRKKDAEKRLKKKLINEQKREIRSELLNFAKQEKDIHDGMVRTMEDWLTRKKLDEAY